MFFRPTKWSELSNQPNENRENVKMAREERWIASSNKTADITRIPGPPRGRSLSYRQNSVRRKRRCKFPPFLRWRIFWRGRGDPSLFSLFHPSQTSLDCSTFCSSSLLSSSRPSMINWGNVKSDSQIGAPLPQLGSGFTYVQVSSCPILPCIYLHLAIFIALNLGPETLSLLL